LHGPAGPSSTPFETPALCSKNSDTPSSRTIPPASMDPKRVASCHECSAWRRCGRFDGGNASVGTQSTRRIWSR
jgi:hypothetical protein